MTPPYCDRCSADLADNPGCEHDHCGDCAAHCLDCEIAHSDARAELDRQHDLETT